MTDPLVYGEGLGASVIILAALVAVAGIIWLAGWIRGERQRRHVLQAAVRLVSPHERNPEMNNPTLTAAMPLLACALDRKVRQQQEEKRAQLVDEWMQVTGLSTKETRDLISKIEERLEK